MSALARIRAENAAAFGDMSLEDVLRIPVGTS